jgi:hypothetical protein
MGPLFWIIVGLAATALTVAYWDRIKNWLNTVVADRLEKVMGYGARKRLHHAVSIADKVAGGIRNRLFIYVKKKNGVGYDKMEEKLLDDFNTVEDTIVQEINEKGPVIQEFTYTE